MPIPRRASRILGALGLVVLAGSCESVEDPFPPQGALSVDVTYSRLGSQSSPPEFPQVVIWSIDEASASSITGFDGDYSFLRAGSCFYPLNVISVLPLNRACRVSGLTLAPGIARTATLTFRISSLELRKAARPDLRLGADPDGDGIPNGVDNCPIVPNPLQQNANASQEITKVGDACSKLDSSEPPLPIIPDNDLDGVANASDNCLWYPNPLVGEEVVPPDTDRDGIGDACERVAAVNFPSRPQLAVTCAVEFTTRSSIPSVFRLDFSNEGVLDCDAGFSGCSIDPSALVVALVGTAETFPCEEIPIGD